MGKRISHNNVGEIFNLHFTGENKTEKWILVSFQGYTNVPETWKAQFRAYSLTPGIYGSTFEAYRNKGRWVCGENKQIIRSL